MRFPRLTITARLAFGGKVSACLAALAGAAVLSTGAHAAANCDMYAKLAMQQQQEAAESKCGFTGPQWSPDMKAHISWCGGVGPDQWKAELQARQQKLDACKSK